MTPTALHYTSLPRAAQGLSQLGRLASARMRGQAANWPELAIGQVALRPSVPTVPQNQPTYVRTPAIRPRAATGAKSIVPEN